MLNASHTGELGSPAADVWAVVGDWAGLIEAMGAPVAVEGAGVGALRRIGPAGETVERLEAQDDDARTVSYSIVQAGPMPLKNYRGTIAVTEISSGRSSISWAVTFEADGIEDAHAVKLAGKIVRIGVEKLQERFGS